MSWASFIAGGVGRWTKQGAISLGVGVIAYSGWEAVGSAIETAVSNAFGAVGNDVYQILALAGFIDVVGIWLGCFSIALTLMVVRKLGLVSGAA